MFLMLALLAALVLDAPPPGGQSAVHERRVTLTGLTNLRDLGGYKTSDGKRVRWGLVYRSDQLAQLTDEGFAELAQRGITTVCDLRRDDERGVRQRSGEDPWRRRFCCGSRRRQPIKPCRILSAPPRAAAAPTKSPRPCVRATPRT